MGTWVYQPFKMARWSFRISFFALLVCYLIGFRYFLHTPLPDSALGFTYLITAYTGHFAALGLIFWLLLVFPITLLIPFQRLVRGLVIAELLAIIVVMVGDTFVFLQYRFHINMFIWKLLLNDSNGEVFVFSAASEAMAALFIAAVLGGLLWLSRKVSAMSRPWPVKRGIAAVLALYLTANLIHIWADAQYIQSLTRFNQNLPVYYPATAMHFMEKHGWVNKDAQQANAAMNISSSKTFIHYPLEPLEVTAPEHKKNILFILIDAWRADEMTPEVSPEVWKFASQHTRYLNHFSGSNATRTGLFSMFYSLPGTYWDAMYANKQGPVFINTLLKEGYRPGIFASAPLTNPEFNRTVFREVPDLRTRTAGATPIARDEKLTEEWLSWIDDHQRHHADQPFFGFLFYDAAHGYSKDNARPAPFRPEGDINYLALGPDTDPTLFRNRYRNAVHQDDSMIGQVLADLQQKQLLDDTIVIITADHGQEFNDTHHNYWGHGSNFTRFQTHVPFIVSWPGKDHQGAQVSQTTTHFDVIPTLMRDALGVSTPDTAYSLGGDLLQPHERKWRLAGSYRDFAIVEKDQIIVSGVDGMMNVYDPDMNEIADPQLNMADISAAMQAMRRFYK